MSLIDHYSYLPTYPLTSGLAYCADYSEIQTPIFSFPPIFPLSFPPPSLSPFAIYLSSTYFAMGRTKKAKVPRSPNESHEAISSTEGKKNGRVLRKTATAMQPEGSGDEPEGPVSHAIALKVPAHVVWDKYPERTERLLDYLDAHPDVTIKLFGDSTQAARSEGRSKLTAKSNKSTGYLQVADGVFSIDNDMAVRTDFAANPNKYAKAIDNYINNT